MKSTLGKVTGVMISLAIAAALVVAIYQTGLVGAEEVKSVTVSEQIAVSGSSSPGSQITQSISNVIQIIISEIFGITSGSNLPSPAAGLSDRITNETIINETVNYTTISSGYESSVLWCDYRSADGSSISDANVEFQLGKDRMLANYNQTSQRYEFVYNSARNETATCVASAGDLSNSTSFDLGTAPIQIKLLGQPTDSNKGKVKRGPGWERSCDKDECTLTLYTGRTFIKDLSGTWDRLGDVVKPSFDRGVLSIDWNGKGIKLAPYIVLDGKKYDNIPSQSNFSVSFENFGDYIKFTPKISYSDGLTEVGFRKVSWSNDEIIIDFTDLTNSGFDVNEDGSYIRITGLSGKVPAGSDLALDPIITLNETTTIGKGNVGGTFVNESSTAAKNTNYATQVNMTVQSNGTRNNSRIYMMWNLSVVPDGASITNANLSLYEASAPSAGRTYNAYNTTNNWTEGNLTWNSLMWNNKTKGTAPSYLQDAEATVATGNWMYWNVTNATITAYSQSNQNMSIMIADSAENSTIIRKANFSSQSAASNRPQLVITYNMPLTYADNSTSTTIAGQPALFSLNWTDNTGLSGYIFSTNNTGTWQNESWTKFETSYGTELFRDDFESGDFSKWTYNSTTSGENVSITSTDSPYGGTYHFHSSSDGITYPDRAQIYKNISSQRNVTVQEYVKFSVLPPNHYGWTITNFYGPEYTADNIVSFNLYNESGTYKWQIWYYDGSAWHSYNYTAAVSANTTYRVGGNVYVDGSDGEVHLYVNDVDVASATGIKTDYAGYINRISTGTDDIQVLNYAYTTWIDNFVIYSGNMLSSGWENSGGSDVLDNSLWTDNNAFSSGGSDSVSTSHLHDGSYSLFVTAQTQPDGWGTRKFLSTNYTGMYMRVYVYLNDTTPATTTIPWRVGPTLAYQDDAVGSSFSSRAYAGLVNDGAGNYMWVARVHDYGNGTLINYNESSPSNPLANTWYSVEIYEYEGNGNGTVKLWIDGVLKVNQSGLNNLYDNSQYKPLNTVIAGFEVQGTSEPSPIGYWQDDAVVSTSYIGPETQGWYYGWSNVTKTLNSTVGTYVQWCVYANDSQNSWNATSCSNPFSLTTATAPRYSNNSTNNTAAGSSTLFSLNWTDDVALSGYIFSTNNSGTWQNSTWSRFGTSAITRVQGNARGTSTSNSISVTLSSTPIEGNVLVAVISTGTSTYETWSRATSISQTGVTWTKQVNQSVEYNDEGSVEIWAGVVGSGASKGITVNLDNTADQGAVADVCEYSGIATSNFLDVNASNSDSTQQTDTGTTVTTAQANELWIGAIHTWTNPPYNQTTPTNGFTLLDGNATDPSSYTTTTYLEKIVSSTGTANSGTTNDGSPHGWVGAIATFKASNQVQTMSTNTTTLNSTVGSTINWCFYANDTNGNWNGTSCSASSSGISTVGQTTASFGYSERPVQKKAMYANGLFWSWYNNGTNYGWRTSSDGVSWSAFNNYGAYSQFTNYTGMSYDSSNNKILLAGSDSLKVYYRQGTPDSSGGITWDSAPVTVVNGNALYTTVVKDSNGYPWIGYTNNSNWTRTYVVNASTTTGSAWGTTRNIMNITNTTASDPAHIALVPLTGDNMLAVAGAAKNKVQSKLYSGGSWGSVVNATASDLQNSLDFDVAPDPGTGNAALVLSTWVLTTDNIIFVKYSGGSWGSEEVVSGRQDLDTQVAVTNMGPDSYRIYYAPNDTAVNSVDRVSGVWTSNTSITNSENMITGYGVGFSGTASMTGGIGLEFTSGTGSPYDIRYISFIPAEYFTLTTTSTLPQYSNNMTNSTAAGKPTMFSLNWTGNVALSGYIFSFNNGSTVWANNTWLDFQNSTGGAVYIEGFENSNNNYFTGGVGGTNSTQSTVVHYGSYAENISMTAAASNFWQLTYNVSAATTLYASAYVNIHNLPASGNFMYISPNIGNWSDWNDLVDALVMNVGGTQRWGIAYNINGNPNTVKVFNTTVPGPVADTWYRVEVEYVSGGGGTGAAYLWVDGVLTESVTGISNNIVGPARTVFLQIGSNATSGMSAITYVDDVVASTSYIGDLNTWSNVTKTINSTIGSNVSWCIYANDSLNNWNATSCSNPFSLTTTSPNPQYFNNTTNATLAGKPTIFSLNWTGSTALSGYIFSFYNGSNTTVSVQSSDLVGALQQIVNKTMGAPTLSGIRYANRTGKASNSWTNPGNTQLIDKQNATTNARNVLQDFYNFSSNTKGGFQIPFGSSIWGINGTIMMAANNGTNSRLMVNVSNNGGTTYYAVPSVITTGTPLANVTMGTVTSTYGVVWNSTTLNDTAGNYFMVRLNQTTAAAGVRVDWMGWQVNYSVPTSNANTSYYEYDNVYSGSVGAITNISVIVNVSKYTKYGSLNLSTSNPDLWLEVWDGSVWSVVGNMTISGIGNDTAYVPMQDSIYPGWLTPANRDIRIKGVYFDILNETSPIYDEINYTDIWVNINGNQDLVNDTWVSFADSTSPQWSNVTKTINSTVGTNIEWCVYANDTDNNWNVTSCLNPFSFMTSQGYLLTSWASGSQLIDTCTSGSLCNLPQNQYFNVSATVNCTIIPSGSGDCGVVSGSLLYNDTTSTSALVNTSLYTLPFYIVDSDQQSNAIWYNSSVGLVGGIMNGTYSPSMAYDPTDRRTILFGGDSSTKAYNDTWIYNYTDNKWYNSSATAAVKSIPARYGASMVYDSYNNKTILFGGINYSGNIDYNDTLMYNYTDNKWYNSSATAVGGRLVGRYSPSMVYDSYNNKTILFGGQDISSNLYNDTWIYNYTDNKWYNSSATAVGGTIPARYGASMVYDSYNKRTILFGGDGTAYYNDTWIYNYTDNKWYNSSATAVGGTLDVRYTSSMVYDSYNNKTILFGGTDGIDYYNDTWIYNYTDNKWYNSSATAVGGNLRMSKRTAMVYDSYNKKAILFGGVNSTTYYFNETWILNISQLNTQSCGILYSGQSCQLNWTVNATGSYNSRWNFSSNFSSSYGSIPLGNYTESAYVRIGNLTTFITLTQYLTLNQAVRNLEKYVRSLTQYFTLNQAVRNLEKLIRSLTQYFTLNQAVRNLEKLIRYFTQYLTLSHAVSDIEKYFKSLTQYFTISQSANRVKTFITSITQYLTLSQSASDLEKYIRSFTQYLTLSQASSRVRTAFTSITQYLTLNQAVRTLESYLRSLTQYLTLSQSVSRTQSLIRSFTQYLTLSHIISFDQMVYNLRSVTQYLTLNQSVMNLEKYFRSMTQYITLNQAASRFGTIFKSLTQYFTINQSASRVKTMIASVTSYLTIGHTVNDIEKYIRSFTQYLTLSQASSRVRTAFTSITQYLTLNQAVRTLESYLRSLTQYFTLNQSASDIEKYIRSFTQSFTLNNIIDYDKMGFNLKQITQYFTLSQSVSRTQALIRSMTQYLTLSHTVNDIEKYIRSFTQYFTLNQSVSRMRTSLATITQYFTLGHTIVDLEKYIRSFTQYLTLSQASSRVRTAFTSITQYLTLNQAVRTLESYLRSLTQYFTLNQSASDIEKYIRSFTQSFTLNNIIDYDKMGFNLKQITQYFTLSQSVSRTQSLIRSMTQYLTLSHTVNDIEKYIRSFTQYFTLNQSVSRMRTSLATITQYFTLGHTIVDLEKYIRSFTQYLTLSQASSRVRTAFTSITQYLTLNQAVRTLESYLRSLTQYFTLNQSASDIEKYIRSFTQSFTLNNIIDYDKMGFNLKQITQYFTLSQSVSRTQSLIRSMTQYLTLSHTVNDIEKYIRSFTQYFTLNQSVSRMRTSLATITQYFTLGHTIVDLEKYIRSFTQYLTLSQSVNDLEKYIRSITQYLTLSQSASRVRTALTSVTSYFTLSQSTSRMLTYLRSITQYFTLNQSASTIEKYIRSLTQYFSLNQIVSRLKMGYNEVTITQYLTLNQSVMTLEKYFRSMTQYLTLSQSASRFGTIIKSLTQYFTISQSATRVKTMLTSITQYFTFNNTANTLGKYLKSLTQYFTLSQSASRVKTMITSVTSYFSLGQSTSRILSYLRSLTQSFSINQSTSNLYKYFRSLTQYITFNNIINVLKKGYNEVRVTSYFTINQSVSNIEKYIRSFTQYFTISQSASRFGTIFKSLTQYLTLGQSATRVKTMIESVTSYLTIGHTVADLEKYFKSLTQYLTLNQSASRLRTALTSVTSYFTLSQSTSRMLTYLRSITQYFTLNQSASTIEKYIRSLTQYFSLNQIVSRLKMGYNEVTITQYLTLNQSVMTLEKYFRSMTQYLTLSQSASRFGTIIKSLTQYFTINQSATRVKTFITSITQYFTLGHTVNDLEKYFKSLTQYFTLSQSAIRVRTALTSVTSYFTLGQSTSRMLTYLRSVTQYLTLSQSVSRTQSLIRSFTQYFTLGNIVNSLKKGYNEIRVTSYFTLNQSLSRLQFLIRPFTQYLTLAQAASKLSSDFRSLTQYFTLNQSVNRVKTMLTSITQYFTFNNTANTLGKYLKSVTSYFSINQYTSRVKTFIRTTTQFFSINQSISTLKTYIRSLAQYLTLSQSVSRTQSLIRSMTQYFTLNQIVSRLKMGYNDVVVTQYFALNHTVTDIEKYFRSMTQYLTLSQSASRFGTIIKSLTQYFTISQSINRVRTSFATITQYFTLSHTVKDIEKYIRSFTQYLTLSQSASRVRTALTSVTSYFTLGQSTSRMLTYLRSITQYLTLSQSVSRTQSLIRSFTQYFSLNQIVSRLKMGYNDVVVTQYFALNQSITKLDSYIRSFTQYITLNQSTSRFSAILRSFTQYMTLNQAASRIRTSFIAVTQYITLSETVTRFQSLIRSIFQPLSIMNSFIKSNSGFNEVVVSLQLTLQNGLTRMASLYRYAAQPFFISDSIERMGRFYQTVFQSAALSQSVLRISAFYRSATDYFALLQSAFNQSSFSRSITSFFTADASLSKNLSFIRSIVSSITFDVIGRTGNLFFQLLYAPFNISGSFERTQYLNRALTDFVSFDSIANRGMSIVRYAAISLTVSDSLDRLRMLARELSQGLLMSDSIARLQSLTRTFAQNFMISANGYKPSNLTDRIVSLVITLSDYADRARTFGRILTQPIELSDTFQRLLLFIRTVTQNISLIATHFLQYLCSWFTNQGDCASAGCYWCNNSCQATSCPTQPPVTPGNPSNPGSGGSAGTPPTELETRVPISLSTTVLDVTLYPGEYQLIPIGITNNQRTSTEVSMGIGGDIWPFTLFENDRFTMSAGNTTYANVKFFTMPTTIPGIYNGEITIKSGSTTQRIAVILRVEYEREKLLDVKVDPITKEVAPGDNLEYQVTLYNLGLTKRIDVFLNYTVRGVENSTVIVVNKETMAVDTSLSFIRNLPIPEITTPGLYTIEAIAWYENKSASSVASFSVVKPFWLFTMLSVIFTSWITYIILFIAIPCFYLGRKAYEKVKARKRIKGRYQRPVNLNKLPSKGLWVGKVAETNANAFIDQDKLTTHMIIAGGTGSGKSVAGMDIAEECLKKGIPVIVFDPTVQWTGFVRSCKDKAMMGLYRNFGIKQEEARGFKGTIVQVKDPFLKVEVDKYIKDGEITVFVLNKLTPDQLDYFIGKTVDYMFTVPWKESRALKALIVFDEVHRLLPKYARKTGVAVGAGEGYLAVERACREFRKWGLGMLMISQVLLDFKGAIRAVIATEAQMRTKYEGDIERIKTKYGWEYSTSIAKLETGAGMVQNPEYNDGKPWFIRFRPLLHDTFRLTEEELSAYDDYMKQIDELNKKVSELKEKKVDTYDMELELSLALEKVKTAQMNMAQTYIDSVKSRVKTVEERS